MSSNESLVGRTIAGYEVLELVGEGGMGAVYRGRQVSLDREVALKILAPRLAHDEEFVRRFNREARSIAKVNHSNILQVYDVSSEGDLHMIAMEFVRGKNLTGMLSERGFLDWRECADYIAQAASGLAAAAKANIIHRDVKPDNLMINQDGIVKVSDFGLAKEVSSVDLTQTGDLMGTPAYMSPEQCDGAALDTRTDIYSLGATFYRAATGMLPFTAQTPVAMMYKHKHEALIPPREYMPSLPPALNDIIIRMMAKNRDERFPSMDLVAEAIQRALNGQPFEDLDATIKLEANRASPDTAVRRTSSRQIPRPSTRLQRRDEFDFQTPHSEAGRVDGMSFEQLVAQGDRLMQEGRPVAACDCWRRALGLKPEDRALQERVERAKEASTVDSLKIGEGLLEQGKLNAVRADLMKALKDNPNDIDAREKLAALEYMENKKRKCLRDVRTLISQQKHEEALAIWDELHPALQDRALTPTMDHIRSHVLPCQRLVEVAQELLRQGRFEDALAKWDEATQLDPSNDQAKLGRQKTMRQIEQIEASMREGYEYSIKRQFSAAIDCFNRVLQQVSDHSQAKRYRLEAYIELARQAETQKDYDAAVERWRAVLENDPHSHAAMECLERVTRQRNALRGSIEQARDAMGRRRYGKAIKLWRRALQLQPGNQNAVYGLKEARSRRLWRWRVPVASLVLVGALVAAGVQYFQFQGMVQQGEFLFSGAAPDNLQAYDDAVRQWRKALDVAVVGQLQAEVVERRIRAAEVEKEIAREAALYLQKDLPGLEAQFDVLMDLKQSRPADFPPGGPDPVLVRAQWHMADLWRQQGDWEKAVACYKKAEEICRDGDIALPADQIQYRNAINHYLRARAIGSDPNMDPRLRDSETIKALQDCLDLQADFEPAREMMQSLRNRRQGMQDQLRQATELLTVGRERVGLGDWKGAVQAFDGAHRLALGILEKGHDWSARKIAAEVEWRKQAGEEMVFFIREDRSNDRKLQAFALDRYEWPNQRGATPATVDFSEALRLARTVGKTLPTRDQWQYAAEGGAAKRLYSYGNRYDAALGNTESAIPRPRPTGADENARTPEGIYDMTGNVAEWVIEPRRALDDPEQLTAGGHFDSRKECRNTDFVSLRADITHAKVGFRACLSWELINED